MKLELLESRRMMSISLVGKTLRVAGTQGDDLIIFDSTTTYTTGNSSGHALFVTMNDENKQFYFHEVKRIVVTSGDGNDEIYVPRLFTTGAFHPLLQPERNQEFHVSIPCFIDGGAGNDVIQGGGANDTLRGGAGNDRLDGQTGNDQLFGGSGKDNLIGGLGDDRLSGGKHPDTADYSARRENLAINMLDESPAADPGVFDAPGLAGGAADEHDQIFNDVENVIGGRGDDFISGNFYANYLIGGGGNDSLNGQQGDDTLVGGAGNDFFESSDLYAPQAPWDGVGEEPLAHFAGLTRGNDVLSGGAGRDRATTDEQDIAAQIESLTVSSF